MKIKVLLATLLLLLSIQGQSQITLPKQFRCVISPDGWRENYFTDGTFSFKADAWGNGAVESPGELKPYLEELYAYKIPFKKTKDNLYWGTGQYAGKYYYIVVVPELLTTVSVKASVNGPQFSNYSAWLLQEVRNARNSGREYYLVNYRGKSCYN